jgi:predicted RNase H-like HicB family nuclease
MNGYFGLIHKEPTSCYGVSFPDVLGCISAGDTFEEALTNGKEALLAHLEFMMEDGDSLPLSRSYEMLRKDSETMELAEDAVWVYVENIPQAIAA